MSYFYQWEDQIEKKKERKEKYSYRRILWCEEKKKNTFLTRLGKDQRINIWTAEVTQAGVKFTLI